MATGRVYRQQTPQQRRADRRARLLDAALESFGTAGYQATAIEQLCGSAGVSTRNFYEEFPSKEALLIELHDLLNQRAHAAVLEAIAAITTDDLMTIATVGLRAYFKEMTSDPRCARIAVVESVGVSATVERHRQEAIDRFARVLEAEADRLAAAGLLPRRNYRLTSVAVIGGIYGLVNTWTSRPDWDAILDDVIAEGAKLMVATLTFEG